MQIGEDSLVQILEALDYVLDADLKAILNRKDVDSLQVLAATGKLAHEGLLGHWVDLNQRPSMARALKGMKPYLQSDDPGSEEEPDTYEGIVGLPADHSCLVVPLRYNKELLGALTFDSRTCGAFGEEQIHAVEGFAYLAARTIYEQRRNQDLNAQMQTLALENASLREFARRSELIGRSSSWEQVLEAVRLVAPTDVTVLLQGETGTGKERVARAIHESSSRANGPFVAVNCSVLMPELALSLLFGHEKGAFTGADRRKAGHFELAKGGTLFLDEVAELPQLAQAQLLRVLQEKVFERVGGSESVVADVRVIAATHRELSSEVALGNFRQDLLFRLNTFPLFLPPLRERQQDIPLLASYLLRQIGEEQGWTSLSLSGPALQALELYSWPGNVRELRNLLERAAILSRGGRVEPSHLRLHGVGAVPEHSRMPVPITTLPAVQEKRDSTSWRDRTEETISIPDGYRLPDDLPRLHRATAMEILKALSESGGKQSGDKGAAARLGVPVSTLRSAIQRYGLK